MQSDPVKNRLFSDAPFSSDDPCQFIYSPLIGSWAIESIWYDKNGECGKKEGEWYFQWILGGRGIQDVLFPKGASPDQYGTSLRCYDPKQKIWHISWMTSYDGEFVHLTGKKVGDSIVQEGQGSDLTRRERWTFRDMTADSFLWLGEVSLDDGKTWFLEQEMRGKRIQE